MENPSPDYISYARRLAASGTSYTRAFNLFMLAFQNDPSIVNTYEAEFRSVLLRLNNLLATHNKFDVIFENFGQALKIYPNNVQIMNDVGSHLFKYGYYVEAWENFEEILKLNPHYVNAEKNLNSIKNIMVERWHFRMLNDHIRNEYYKQAIRSTITPGQDSVLDIGTGTGLLAMYACEAGARKTLGCDGSEVMTQMAQRVVVSNKLRNIQIVNEMSTSLDLWKTGGKCTLLVTELFDAGLFGEHVLQMLSHAWSSLLAPTARVIPKAAEFFIIGVQCDQLQRKYQLCNDIKKILCIPTMNVHILTIDETYDSEDVHLINDITYITEPLSVVNTDFNDPKNIEELLERTTPYTFNLKAVQDGVINAVIGYFNLYLSDHITLTTNMRAEDRANAWQQAVFFDALPKTIAKDELYEVDFALNGGRLQLLSSGMHCISRASPEIIRFLNDLEFINLINACTAMAYVYLCQMAEISEITIVDLCPFPFFGLQMLKRGAKSVLCCAKNKYDRQFITDVFRENKVCMSNLTIIYGEDWTPHVFGEDKYHAIFANFLEVCGDVDNRLKDIYVILRQAHLVPGGLFIPAKVEIVAELVSSHWVDINNKLFNENVNNFKIAHCLNDYQVTQNFDIDLNLLKYVPISEPVAVCRYPDGSGYETVDAPIINDGFANAILCWYKIELLENMKEITTKRLNSFMNGMLFLTNSRQALTAGKTVRIAQHKTTEGSFKLVMEPGSM